MTTSSSFFDPREFIGKRALVTGGTKGIGEAIVARLVRGGATVIATARSAPAEFPSNVHFVAADLSTAEGAIAVGRETIDRYGGLDILVNNVGGSSAPGGGALALSDAYWQLAVDTNLFGAVRLDRAFLPSMIEQGSGTIIHISSIQRQLPLFEATLTYGAANAALSNCGQGLSEYCRS